MKFQENGPFDGSRSHSGKSFLRNFFILVLYFRSILVYLAFPGFLPFLSHFGDAS